MVDPESKAGIHQVRPQLHTMQGTVHIHPQGQVIIIYATTSMFWEGEGNHRTWTNPLWTHTGHVKVYTECKPSLGSNQAPWRSNAATLNKLSY